MPSWGKTVTTTLANTAYSLFTLMQGLDTATEKAPQNVEAIVIQADPAGGAAKFWVGNADISPTNHGMEMVATQAESLPSFGGNSVSLKDVYLMSDTAGKKWNIHIFYR